MFLNKMNSIKILVVDNVESNGIVKKAEREILKRGYSFLRAFDGMEGLEKARSEKPDAIITEAYLSKMNGYKLCRLLKFDECYKGIRIILYTFDLKYKEALAKEVGADAYITKENSPEKLVEKVEEILKNKK